MRQRFRGEGFYILDEPEAALSPNRQLAIVTVPDRLAGAVTPGQGGAGSLALGGFALVLRMHVLAGDVSRAQQADLDAAE